MKATLRNKLYEAAPWAVTFIVLLTWIAYQRLTTRPYDVLQNQVTLENRIKEHTAREANAAAQRVLVHLAPVLEDLERRTADRYTGEQAARDNEAVHQEIKDEIERIYEKNPELKR